MFKKIRKWFSTHMPTRRRIIQLYAALLFNANLKGFATGKIFVGATKNACMPGLNCYSCPGATMACPIGALQNSLSASGKRTPYFVLGIILLYSLFFGRWICGFLCPFGLVQDLLHKIKTPKIRKSKITRVLSYFKYVILVFLVVILPLIYVFWDFPLPAFCKYICPAGTLGGAISLLLHPGNSNLFESLGPLFTWKMALLIAFVTLSIFMYRFFCRFFCPLGAIYGLFNKISFLGVQLDKPKCTDCGLCVSKCKMDIHHVGDHECISCGECIDVCPTQAISFKGGRFYIAPNEGEEPAPLEEEETIEKTTSETDETQAPVKTKPRYKAVRVVSWALALAVLVGALVYYNFIDKAFVQPDVGVSVGDTCPEVELKYSMSDEVFKLSDYRGKVVIINFWGTWCSGCVAELPYFDAIATDYKDKAVVVAVHSYHIADTAPAYITANYPNSDIIFVEDTMVIEGEEEITEYVNLTLGGDGSSYPMTVVLDENGVILFTKTGAMTYEMLEEIILRQE